MKFNNTPNNPPSNSPSKPVVRADGQHIDTLIGVHAHFVGELIFEGAVRIDGSFEGNIRSKNEGTLVISVNAKVKGEIDVHHLILYGSAQGNVRALKSLQVGNKGQLNGDVEYTVMTLAEGAAINGRCSRITEQKEAPKSPQAAMRPDQKPSISQTAA